jgi:NTE family protein
VVGLSLKGEYYKGNFYNSEFDSIRILSNKQTTFTGLHAYFSFDNLDHFYFPTRGVDLYGEVSFMTDEFYTVLYPVVLLKSKNIIPLPGSFYMSLNLYGRAIFAESIHQFKETYVGGIEYSIYFSNHLPFLGLPPVSEADRFTFIGMGKLGFVISKKHHISLTGNVLTCNDEIYSFEDYRYLTGTALSYSFHSGFGPLDLTIGYSEDYKKLTVSANAGFWF